MCSDKTSFTIRTESFSVDGGLFLCEKAFRKGEVALLRLNPLVKGKPIIMQAVVRVAHHYLLTDNRGFGNGFVFARAPTALTNLIKYHLDKG